MPTCCLIKFQNSNKTNNVFFKISKFQKKYHLKTTPLGDALWAFIYWKAHCLAMTGETFPQVSNKTRILCSVICLLLKIVIESRAPLITHRTFLIPHRIFNKQDKTTRVQIQNDLSIRVYIPLISRTRKVRASTYQNIFFEISMSRHVES